MNPQAAKARVEEARDWLVIVESLLKGKERYASAKRVLRECRQRVADLERIEEIVRVEK